MQEIISTIANFPRFLHLIMLWAVLWVAIYFLPRKLQPAFFGDKKWLKAVIVIAIGFAPILALLFLAVLAMLFQTAQTLLTDKTIEATDLRWYALTFVGLLTALGGIIGTPLALIRVFTTERQTAAQETGLITDRINKAVESLGAQNYTRKMVDHPQFKKHGAGWKRDEFGGPVPQLTAKGQQIITRELLEYTEPNIEVRIGAIYALERIAKEDLSFHIQIMEILCAYIRHNAPASLASDDPQNLTEPRDDIQTALTVLGRRFENQIAVERAVKTPDGKGHRLDLRTTCLQTVDLSNLNFELANFEKANLQEAHLGAAKLQGAVLQGANLQGANLWDTNLQRAILWDAKLRGANLWHTKIDDTTSFTRALLRGTGLEEGAGLMEGSGLREVDFTHFQNPALLAEAFGDATVTLPDGLVAGQGELAHWSAERLGLLEFHEQWHTHKKSIEYKP